MAERRQNVPVKRQGEGGVPTRAWGSPAGLWPGFSAEMDRMFNNMLRGWPFERGPRGSAGEAGFAPMPSMDVIDKEKEIVVKAELPGMEQEDIDVQLADNTLRIRGEKREEREEGEAGGDYHLSELSYGSFQRSVALPPDIDHEACSASFRNGVLTIKLPRTQEAQSKTRKIEVK